MKNLIIKIIALFLFIMVYSLTSFAQHDHSSHGGGHSVGSATPPNGGVVKEAGKYKIEMVANMFSKKDKLRFYVFKGNFKSILNNEITGKITIEYSNGAKSTQTLEAKGDKFFVAQVDTQGSFNVIVKFIIKGKNVSASFHQKGFGDTEVKTYTCPMHPEIVSSSLGKCPKCGMALTEKESNESEVGTHQHSH